MGKLNNYRITSFANVITVGSNNLCPGPRQMWLQHVTVKHVVNFVFSLISFAVHKTSLILACIVVILYIFYGVLAFTNELELLHV